VTNRLRKETSPYLRQHADNPVDWYPWDEHALAVARETGKPILLSIGYSACHWCHVMAHECFEDAATAELMNASFVNIKVDREERPDLDKIYQLTHQLIAQRPGGWPLTVFLTPDEHVPIFSGTYFPRERFKVLLERVQTYYREHSDDLDDHANALSQAFENMTLAIIDDDVALDLTPLAAARQALAAQFDREHGGFGGAPKFPHPTHVQTLLRAWRDSATSSSTDLDALLMATLTLTRMAEGGLYDHLGGGFFRYSVDATWTIPHFEKMLYDNAALLGVYANAFAATGEPLFGEVAAATADWCLRDMRDPRGGFYATLDADSEGEEGKFYLWTREQVAAVLETEAAALVAARFGLDSPPNFENRAWHLRVAPSTDGTDRDATDEVLDAARQRLLEARSERVWPTRDDKVLTAWNGLMISGLSRAARALGRTDLLDAADDAVRFVRESMWADGRLLATSIDGRARHAAYLDDYAFLALGIVDLVQVRWSTSNLRFAIDLVDVLLAHFEADDGGFYFTADDHETLIHRPKPFADEALPSGNGVAAQTLTILGHLLGEPRYLEAAERTVQAAWPALKQYPHAHGALLEALGSLLDPHEIVVLRGPAAEIEDWRAYLSAGFNPSRLLFAIDSAEAELPGLLAERVASDKGTVAYVCQGTRCRAPIDTLESLMLELDSEKNSAQ
jgi:uncharacterized protein YyaL (SSP411 family)